MKKNCLIWLALLAFGGKAAADEHEMFWFKNEMQCGVAKVVVRSLCEQSDPTRGVVPFNSLCSEQELRITQPGSKPVKLDLLARETDMENFKIVSSLRCGEAENKPYLYMMIDNGGNCDKCEIDAVIDLQGRWKRYDKRWLTKAAAERKAISKKEAEWFRQEPFYLQNITRE
ncbi:hypothetical protein HSX11_08830 [Oxalobacteraceae bacterium]|nr:hypothetical protein [Oxalobacteraceae bacterium]